tara:strand:+ start:288 stop:503 length:216 start_codon:yes stop_codon:yes gene_type:complete
VIKLMKIKFKNFGLGKKMAKIQNKYYMFVSVGHPWNECAAYLSDKDGNILEDEPVVYSVCGSAYSLAMELM